MSTTQPFCLLIGIHPGKLSKEESIFLEAALFSRICHELKDVFRKQYREYFQLMKFTLKMENAMLDANLLSLVLKDILSTEDYTLEGVANYTDTHEDVIREVVSGCNVRPSAILLQRSIDLHRVVRRELYQAISKKIVLEHSDVA